jgi:hypothetical protein
MNTITLTRGYLTVVDDEDFEWLNQWSWQVSTKEGRLFYARRSFKDGSSSLMHRCILNA